MDLQQIKELLKQKLSVTEIKFSPVGGGSINDTYKVETGRGQKYFLKLNSRSAFPGLFEKEKNGLEFLAKQNCVLTPAVISCETYNDHQLLLLEWIEQGIRNHSFWEKFGEHLAQLHHITHQQFGFPEDNYMGSLPQKNNFSVDWTPFFITNRLQPQVELANRKALLEKKHTGYFESLFKKLDSFFEKEKPSLLHGDLWGGNFMCNEQSMPLVIDPAVYFGHRGMDLAMTTLFGGFDRSFYDSYNYYFPLPGNYPDQWELCNLYPLLIHLNLFGKGYLHDIERTLHRFS